MNATAYIRVSSKAQNLAMQRHAIEQEAARRGDTIVEWYSEKRSAKTSQRPELERLRADIRAGCVRKVYGFRFDRFLRTGPADAFKFAEECHQNGVELVTVADGLHLKPGKDDVVTSVLLFAFSLAAKLERAAINDRIAAARERLEAEGKPWGRPSRLTSGDVAKIVALQAQGLSHRAIAVRVHVPRSTVTLALKRAAAAA
ncbi:recombinase family protein [Anaeromyxobacter sp. Fw109-5]|uniref:recombinase family protein n=1 Tax=Anaeromyxobacter sp. (strain Fw109-5) TaxID=404589 RepID=UPI0000ED7363|nr:recombinase family protein [Anaeromyxobacter sp. Fw109-5]ABS26857.1 Resolvase domain [Anaeromyxobacter sp. Fw109-5]